MIHLSSIFEFLCNYKVKQLPNIFSMYLTEHGPTHNYSTRNGHNYSIRKIKKLFSDCAVRNCGPAFWNSLDKKQNIAKLLNVSEINGFSPLS